MAAKMTAFFKPMTKAPEPEMLHWKTTRALLGTTALIEVSCKARVGSYAQHTVHGKVKLLGQPSPDRLEIEIMNVDLRPGGTVGTKRAVVDAVECSDPQAVARARDPSVYSDTDEAVAAALTRRAIATAISACGEAPAPAAAGKAKAPTAKGKGKSKAQAGNDPAAPKNRGGRQRPVRGCMRGVVSI